MRRGGKNASAVGLEPVPEFITDTGLCEIVNFSRSENANSKWIELITEYLQGAKVFEIHCWSDN